MLKIIFAAVAALVVLQSAVAQAPAGEGYLVVSIGDRPDLVPWQLQYGGCAFKFRQIGGGKEGQIEFHRTAIGASLMQLMSSAVSASEPDYKIAGSDNDGRGIVEVRKLPAGDYEIYAVEIYASVPAAEVKWWPKHDLSLKFHVPADGAVYIGNITTNHVSRKNWLGYDVPDGATYAISDEAVRDEAIARKKVPSLPGLTKQKLDLSDPDTAAVFHLAEQK